MYSCCINCSHEVNSLCFQSSCVCCWNLPGGQQHLHNEHSEAWLKCGISQSAVMRFAHAELEGGRDDPRFPGSDRRYAHNKPEDLPLTESLKTTVDRFMPLWQETIAPAVKSGKNVIIAAHGNSLRVSIDYYGMSNCSCAPEGWLSCKHVDTAL